MPGPPATAAATGTSLSRSTRPSRVRYGSMTSMPGMACAQSVLDRPPVRMTLGFGAAVRRQLVRDGAEQHEHEPAVADDGAALHGGDRVAADGVLGHDERNARQLGGPARERIDAQAGAGCDRATDERAVRAHHVERRGRAHVDHDRRRSVETQRGEGVDQAVVANPGGIVDQDLNRDRRRRRQPGAGCRAARPARRERP